MKYPVSEVNILWCLFPELPEPEPSADDGVVYSYFVSSGESAVIPFTSGSGTYQVSCYEQVNGSQYAALFAQALEVSLENEFLPFLYPNQYVNFTPDSEACKLALSLPVERVSSMSGRYPVSTVAALSSS